MNFKGNKEGGIWKSLEGRKKRKIEVLLKSLKRIIKGDTLWKKKDSFTHVCSNKYEISIYLCSVS